MKSLKGFLVVISGIALIITELCYAQPKDFKINNALLGFWRLDSRSTFWFLNITPKEKEILLFRSDGIIDFQIEGIKFARGEYKVIDSNRLNIRFYATHVQFGKNPEFMFSILGDELTITHGSEKAIYSKIKE
jgi:hypothetical protein